MASLFQLPPEVYVVVYALRAALYTRKRPSIYAYVRTKLAVTVASFEKLENVTVVGLVVVLPIEIEELPAVADHDENLYPGIAVADISYAVPFAIPVTLPETVLPLASLVVTVRFFDGIVKFA